MQRVVCFVFIAAMSSIGCGGNVATGGDDAVGEDGKADQVNPTGHENEGYLLVQAPPTTRGFAGTPQLSYRGTALNQDAKTRFTKGTGCLALYNNLMSDCAVTVDAKQTTTYQLASLYVHWDPATLAVDFGPDWTVTVTRGDARLMSAIARAPFTNDVLTLPGDFHIAFNGLSSLPAMDVTIAAGEAKDIDLTTTDKRATIHVIPPSSRSFPNSACSRSDWLAQRSDSGTIVRQMAVPATADASYKVMPLAAADGSHYEMLTADGSGTPLTVAAGQTVDFKVKRIDVNDVSVTREDGSTYAATGSYVVSRKDLATGTFQPLLGGCASNTATGLDVAPGVYKITTSWTTADGPDSEDDVLDLR
jgi:hypothetical protein